MRLNSNSCRIMLDYDLITITKYIFSAKLILKIEFCFQELCDSVTISVHNVSATLVQLPDASLRNMN